MMNTISSPTSGTPQSVCPHPSENVLSAVQECMQSIALSQQQLMASSEAKNNAFIRRIENLTALINQLSTEQASLDRQLILEASARSTSRTTHHHKMDALKAKARSLTLANQSLENCISCAKQELAAMQESYQAKFQGLTNEQAQTTNLNNQLASLQHQRMLVESEYIQKFQQCKNMGIL